MDNLSGHRHLSEENGLNVGFNAVDGLMQGLSILHQR